MNKEPEGIADSKLSSSPEQPPPLFRGQPRVQSFSMNTPCLVEP